jgi:hypothetical protein
MSDICPLQFEFEMGPKGHPGQVTFQWIITVVHNKNCHLAIHILRRVTIHWTFKIETFVEISHRTPPNLHYSDKITST